MPTWGRLDVTGDSGPIRNTFLRQGGAGLAVVLPGRLGGWLTAAVYYPVLALLDEGLDALCLDSIYRDEVPPPSRLRADAAAAVRAGMAAGDYRQLVLVGKSLGTFAMAELILEDQGFAGGPSIWLTPLLQDDRVAAALNRLETPGLIVIGTEDPQHDAGVLAGLEARGHRVLTVAGAHHGLAIDGDAIGSVGIPRQLVDATFGYVRAVGTGSSRRLTR